jgi:hypothetical protein
MVSKRYLYGGKNKYANWRLVLGPVVRISPNEVHCNDISFSDEIYAVGGRKRDKPLHQINGSA